jgi:hypothetical protein
MIVMPSNNSSMHLGWLAGQYPGRIGWLLGPTGWRNPHRWLPYGCDNDKFAATVKRKEWDEVGYLAFIAKVARMSALGRPPRFVLVPDVPFDREGTLIEWAKWAPRLRPYGWRLAFAVQDGMTQDDVPVDADVIFVGGSTEWKWATVWDWCANNDDVHVGRVNSYRLLWHCHDAGAEYCDGTGWYRGNQEQLAGLERYLKESTKDGRAQQRLIA